MKHYNQPETKFLQVINSSIVCASAPGPVYSPVGGQIGDVSQKNFTW